MFVETYDQQGNSTGYDLYEVGSVHMDSNGNWVGDAPNSYALSHDSLDSNMGLVAGSVSGASAVGSGSTSVVSAGSASIGSAGTGIALDNLPIESGVSVRHYSSYDEMKNAAENARYTNVFNFNTTREQDLLIRSEAERTGVNFGKYNLFTNNCTQHASNALSAGGVNTTSFLVPNGATSYIKKHNNSSFMTVGWR